jgi:hypothetical protein
MSDDRSFDAFLAGAREQLTQARASAGRPDFLDVLARAHEHDPDKVTAEWVDAAEQATPVIRLSGDSAREEGALDAWISDARASVQQQVRERRMRAVPTMRSVQQPRRSGVAVAWWLGAAAAVVVGAVGLRGATTARVAVTPAIEQAVLTGASMRTEHTAVHSPEPAAPKLAPRGSERPIDIPAPSVAPPSVEEALIEAPPETERVGLRELSERAEAKWRAGELAEAQRLYERVIARGGRRSEAELAYADLFSLVQQRGGKRRAMWSAYLRKFPDGRFADDARAGLCRTAPEPTREVCWRAYLDRGGGAYRAEAERAVGDR